MARRRLRLAAIAGIAGALTFPAAASAGPFAALGEFFGDYEGGQALTQPLGGDRSAFALVSHNLESQENYQTLTGSIGGDAFAGFLVLHSYDHATDHVVWNVTGTADPTGAAPPQPVSLFFDITYDRIQEKNTVSITGKVNGEEVVGQAETVNIPTPYQLLN